MQDESLPLDGAASNHDMIFKPTSVWYGGLLAGGTFSGDGLTLTGTGFSLRAVRSSLDDYQAAVAHLQSVAGNDRQAIAIAQAASDVANKTMTIENDATRLRNDTQKMDAGVANCPDFGKQAESNTARIAKMLRAAPMLTGVDRSQLAVEASQIEVETNQIEVARSQYVIGLNQIVQDAASIAGQLRKFCNSSNSVQFAQPCRVAKAEATDFVASLGRGHTAFGRFKQAVEDQLAQQSTMIRRIQGG